MASSGTARDLDEAAQRFVVMAIFTLASVIGAFNRTKLNGRAIRRRTVRRKLSVTGPAHGLQFRSWIAAQCLSMG
jgi:hypothetical protein